MKAATVTDTEVVQIREVERPVPKNGEVIIKVSTAGVCGSDLHLFQGTHAFRKPPAVLGHEVTGRIVEVGRGVDGFAVGERVTVEPHLGCGQCEFCRQDLVNLCLAKSAPGTATWMGTFVEYFNAPAVSLYKLDDAIDDETGVLIEPLAVAVHVMERATMTSRDAIVILGAGSVGLLTQVVAREMGFKTIITTDTARFNREMSLRYGATASFDPLAQDVPARVRELTAGRGADLAIIAAGADGILDQASSSVRKRGEIGLVAMITKRIPFYSYGIVFNEQNLYGSMTYETRDFKKAAEMINGGLALPSFITHRFPLDRSQEALSILSRKEEDVLKVVVTL